VQSVVVFNTQFNLEGCWGLGTRHGWVLRVHPIVGAKPTCDKALSI